jgi:hypothetical protein
MRHESVRRRSALGALAIAIVVGTLAFMAPQAQADPRKPPKGMPLVLPVQSVPVLRQLNRATNFNVLRLSQVAIGNTGDVSQMAIVDVRQKNQQFNRIGPFPLFLLARDLPLVQQLNQGANINTLAVFQTAIGNTGTVDQVALVTIQQTNNALAQIGPNDLLLVAPPDAVPALQQLNSQTNFNMVRVSQVAAGNTGPVSQTALVSVQQKNGVVNTDQPFPMFVRAQDLPRLVQLNIGLNINIVNVFQVAVGNTGPVTQVALVNVTQNNQALGDINQGEDDNG